MEVIIILSSSSYNSSTDTVETELRLDMGKYGKYNKFNCTAVDLSSFLSSKLIWKWK